MGEIKPGCLALVYGLVQDAEDNGKVVTAESLLSFGDIAPDGGVYLGGSGWLCYSAGIANTNGSKGFAFYNPANLMPIYPSADPLEQTQEQEQTA